ncbi:hypothetical protein OE88DRAFT_1667635 [Heliocybe sulcata]|uniref:Uncharacterized protein n=1 Tax=Heliocybe sulcata TaxID=5364 RepID=A0A5C3MQE9_9AGAM|nr:hypothetical protein OE88DRAFT_1667635 [Heliocybe sulcata]
MMDFCNAVLPPSDPAQAGLRGTTTYDATVSSPSDMVGPTVQSTPSTSSTMLALQPEPVADTLSFPPVPQNLPLPQSTNIDMTYFDMSYFDVHARQRPTRSTHPSLPLVAR